MNKIISKLKSPKGIIFISLVLLLVTFYIYNSKKDNSEKVTHDPIPSIGLTNEYEDYEKTFKTYNSQFGFSFQYPPHLYVMEDPEPFIPERLYVLPTSVKTDTSNIYGVVISTAENEDGMTPLKWLKGPNSGADLSQGYNVLDIDGQEAISLDGGTWVVVDTPDKKYQISIALLPGKNGDLLFTEIGIIISSLKFSK
jgi:hypothetical protein